MGGFIEENGQCVGFDHGGECDGYVNPFDGSLNEYYDEEIRYKDKRVCKVCKHYDEAQCCTLMPEHVLRNPGHNCAQFKIRVER